VKTDLDPTLRLETQASQAYFRPRNDKIAQTQTKPPKNNQPESSFGCHHVVLALALLCSTGEPTRLLPSGSPMVQRPGIRRRQPAWLSRCDHHSITLPPPHLVPMTRRKLIRLSGLPVVKLNAGSASWFVLSLMFCTIPLQFNPPAVQGAAQKIGRRNANLGHISSVFTRRCTRTSRSS
jgi:hypothetical protein